MRRNQDWLERLFEYVEQHRDAPFEWGVHDCCRFANGAVVAMTGENPMADYHYSNEIGAIRLIKSAGSLDALLERTLGERLPAVALAKRGDVVIADLRNGATVGVVLGAVSAFAAETGLLFVPTQTARAAWRIG